MPTALANTYPLHVPETKNSPASGFPLLVAGGAVVPALAGALVPATVVVALLPEVADDTGEVVAVVPALEPAGRAAVVPADAATVPVPAPAATLGMVATWVVPALGDVMASPVGAGLLQAAASATQVTYVQKPVRIPLISSISQRPDPHSRLS
jgi:hypothetical protein